MTKVLRDGKLQEIHVSEVVVGDVVYLQAGDKMPADGVVEEGAVKVDQAALNGETEEADKIPLPEGLPMLTSILLSFRSLRMEKDNVLVRKINGLETAGSLSILFSDKTGTITEGRLSVVEMATGNVYTFDALAKMTPALAADVVTGIGINNSAVASNGQIIGGNSTDRALMSFLVIPIDMIRKMIMHKAK